MRVEVGKGDAVRVVFEVRRRNISFWDVGRQQWGVVGASSRNLRLRGGGV